MNTIFTALAPNFQKDDAWLAFKLLFQPWRWKKGADLNKFGDWILFDSGRTGLEAILKCLQIGAGDEVLLQAFTCVVVPNAVRWVGARPVYVDCNEEYTMSLEDLKRKLEARPQNPNPEVSPRGKPKAIIVQHTFGNMADMEAIKNLASQNNLIIIEDCAHTMNFQSDISFFSFGRDKVISAVFGGGVAVKHTQVRQKLIKYQKVLPMPSMFWIKRQLLYVPYMVFVRATYDLVIGKMLSALARKLHFFSKPVTSEEKISKKPKFLGHQMPNALAILALHQLTKLDKFEAHRKKIAGVYKRALPNGSGILRFTLCILHSQKIREEAKRSRIFLGDWYTSAIAPTGVAYDTIGYDPTSCPIAERLAVHSINLPTDIHITQHDAQRIISTIRRLGAL